MSIYLTINEYTFQFLGQGFTQCLYIRSFFRADSVQYMLIPHSDYQYHVASFNDEHMRVILHGILSVIVEVL